MSDPFYLGAYWGPRREDPEQCADRLSRCLVGLASDSELLDAWFPKANRRSKATGAPVSVDSSALAALFRSGQNRRDADGSPIAELGLSVALWNGDFKRAVGLSVKCGAWSPVVPNSFVLSLPAADDGGSELYQPETARTMMRAVIASWEPEWATWTSHALREVQQPEPGAPVLGWATYLSSGRAVAEVGLPQGVEVEPIGAGVLLTVGRSPAEVPTSLLLATRELVGAS